LAKVDLVRPIHLWEALQCWDSPK